MGKFFIVTHKGAAPRQLLATEQGKSSIGKRILRQNLCCIAQPVMRKIYNLE
jgi:hypothetical protein